MKRLFVWFIASLLCASGASGHLHVHPSPRIVLGQEVTGYSNSAYCTLYVEFSSDSGTGLCGCSLLEEGGALSAAHCFLKEDPLDGSLEYFRLARVRLYGEAKPADGSLLIVRDEEVNIHPGYSSATLANDIAYLSLPSVALSRRIVVNDAERLWNSLTLQDALKVVGVGLNRFQKYSLGVPKETFLSRRDCENPEGPGALKGWSYDAHLGDACAGPFHPCVGDWCGDSCSGDSGGPLFAEDNGTVLLYGLVSRGHRDCGVKGGYPGIYTALHRHSSFINQSATGIVTGFVNNSYLNVKEDSSVARESKFHPLLIYSITAGAVALL